MFSVSLVMRGGLFLTSAFFFFCSFSLSTELVAAQVRSSTNYQLQSDSINFGGGLSTSTNYTQESTFGEVATGVSSSTNFIVGAGYQQMQVVFLSLSSAADVEMSPALGGISGGESNGSTTVVATSDSPSGYQLSLTFENDPAMQGSNGSIADYEPAGNAPDFTFTTAASDSHFGFSPFGDDVPARYKNNASVCNSGSNITTLNCWDSPSTTARVIATNQDSNHPNGATTTIYFKVGVGNFAAQVDGVYTATSTLTLIAL